ncbi:MAG: nitroreductase [Actinomycetota bacterium]|nr:nitroreductase [Actinomycetota bacterium]
MKEGYRPRITPWSIDESLSSSLTSFEDMAKFLVSYAILAPSGHNTQPWRFAIKSNSVEVYADYSRRLPVADGDDRELTMSIGAAITNLEVAAAHFGLKNEVRYHSGNDKELMARVILQKGDADKGLLDLFPAITGRRTNRLAFKDRELEAGDLEKLRRNSTFGQTSVQLVTDKGMKDRLAELIDEGDRVRMADRSFRKELGDWIRPAKSIADDGLMTDSIGIPGFLSWAGPWMMRTFNIGKSQGKKDADLAAKSAAIAVVLGSDSRDNLLDAGRLFERFTLTLTNMGMGYSFFNLPVEVPALRVKLKAFLDIGVLPQLLFRIGYAHPPDKAAPRRAVESVLLRES